MKFIFSNIAIIFLLIIINIFSIEVDAKAANMQEKKIKEDVYTVGGEQFLDVDCNKIDSYTRMENCEAWQAGYYEMMLDEVAAKLYKIDEEIEKQYEKDVDERHRFDDTSPKNVVEMIEAFKKYRNSYCKFRVTGVGTARFYMQNSCKAYMTQEFIENRLNYYLDCNDEFDLSCRNKFLK